MTKEFARITRRISLLRQLPKMYEKQIMRNREGIRPYINDLLSPLYTRAMRLAG